MSGLLWIGSDRVNREPIDPLFHSKGVWEFYDETLKKLHEHGGRLVRLDAFAYLHKKPGAVNLFNNPGTSVYLGRLQQTALSIGSRYSRE